KQIQEMKEAFSMIDVDRDGFVSKEDIKAISEQLGRAPDDKELTAMLKEAPGPLNFTMFLSIFSDKLSGTDSEETIRNAFAMFDEQETKKLNIEYIKDLLENMGDNFNKDEMRMTFKEAPVEGGKFDYVKFTAMIKG
nr:Chain Y, MYOSIN REGULATORY LIGHT CHAIN, STRIATED ADDUCTOR MUSCLE [Argopecten irradians]2W4V_Y Chain Y, MYOSIN REGULATORY LIGHT CHAIN, STRIATED ADDUCTOR MUSCLE [Argopecten irradians]2W4W_Y Chain Y, MYOSIN REGULATORY LIGHT CHAIN, STRIATED ADDUCTOR MUSCLE [Argopecten irradians]